MSFIGFFLSNAQFLDNTFADNGIYFENSFSPGGPVSTFKYETGAITDDSKILVAGTFTYSSIGKSGGFVRRLNLDGSIDNTFNLYVRKPVNIEEKSFGFRSIFIQPDQKILLGDTFCYNLTRLNKNGDKDLSFGFNGEISESVINNNFNNFGLKPVELRKIYSSSDGKILVLCSATNIADNSKKSIIFQLNEDGSINNSFGNNGALIQDGINGSFLLNNNKLIFVTHNIQNSSSVFTRFELNGQIDASFNTKIINYNLDNGYKIEFIDAHSDGNYIYMGGNGH